VKIGSRTRRFIGESMVVRLATVSDSERPRVTPLWFIFESGRFYMNTRPRLQFEIFLRTQKWCATRT
jgi:nitroimidazol reductase NimA-like FMN-containing flavoprotein (pyridoxamine 5'-phosphate oxidase superfamily)